MKPVKSDVFRAYDIRGMVGEDFDPEWVEALGKACGTYFLQNGLTQAVVGRDCRHSSPEYQTRMVEGLIATGVDVIALPMVPTPVMYFAVKTLQRQAGVMITASHNPPEFNGFKVWAGNDTIHTSELQKIYAIMAEGAFAQGSGVASELDIGSTYRQTLTANIALHNPVRVVVDGGNGSAGEVCADLLASVGAEVIPIYCNPDPDFPNHHPDPTVMENITDLQAMVRERSAHFGAGLDGDGDRIGVVDEQGNILYGDQLLAIYARDVLRRHPGSTVIGEVKCSHLLFQDIAQNGGNPLMWKTGHSLIKAKMREAGGLLAGEMSGHMFFADRYFGYDDAIYASCRLIEILARTGKPLSELLADVPPTYSTPEIRVDCPDNKKFKLVAKLTEDFQKQYNVIDIDGARIVFDDGWGLVRASNTQPALVLRFEALSQERLEEIRSLVESRLEAIKQNL